jgi:hypothetical protein
VKSGGRIFDIEVDVPDIFAYECVSSINRLTEHERKINYILAQVPYSNRYFFVVVCIHSVGMYVFSSFLEIQ